MHSPDRPWKFGDGFMYLAAVKTHLANHQPMTDGDQDAWKLCDYAQTLCALDDEEHEVAS